MQTTFCNNYQRILLLLKTEIGGVIKQLGTGLVKCCVTGGPIAKSSRKIKICCNIDMSQTCLKYLRVQGAGNCSLEWLGGCCMELVT